MFGLYYTCWLENASDDPTLFVKLVRCAFDDKLPICEGDVGAFDLISDSLVPLLVEPLVGILKTKICVIEVQKRDRSLRVKIV